MIEIWLPNDKKKAVFIVDGKRIEISKKDITKIWDIVRDYVEMKEGE